MTLVAHPVRRIVVGKETVLRILLFLMLSVGSISFAEPSPYEVVFLVFVPVVLIGHIVLTRVTMTLVFLVLGFLGSEVLALTPYFSDRPTITTEGTAGATATIYVLETTYLFFSLCIFAIVFTRHTRSRLNIALIAYALSCFIAAVWGIAAYLNVPGVRDSGLIEGRIAGPFKDPNVLGSYSVLGVLFLTQSVLFGAPRWRILSFVALAVVLFGGIFLPLSRGAWGATIFSTLFLGIATFCTADNRRMKRTIIASAAVLAFAAFSAGLVVASNETLRTAVLDRAKLEQDYDSGPAGRFGNQKRSIPMLLDRPLGFGPHRFSFYFELDPHNSYIGAFSSAGWMGGAFFLLFVVVTSTIGLRLAIRPNPFRRQAQVLAPALVSAFFQAVQIDIDHWRFIYLMAGSIWGMEAGRQLLRRRSLYADEP